MRGNYNSKSMNLFERVTQTMYLYTTYILCSRDLTMTARVVTICVAMLPGPPDQRAISPRRGLAACVTEAA
jgi:hypothetical protein